jgi:hypothetical protein
MFFKNKLYFIQLFKIFLNFMWHPTSSGNEDVLICINASFMTQRVLKPWWSWTYQNSAVKHASAWAIPGWVTSWEVWFGGAKSGQYCVIGGGSLQMVSESLPSLRWREHAQAQWGTPAGTLGPKRGWLWRPTSPGNEDVLICINASFMTQRVTSWEVWFGGAKSEQYCVIGGRSLHFISQKFVQ